MKALVFSALIALLPGAPVWALLGPDIASDKILILWIPPESFSDWKTLTKAFERNPDLKLTIGLSPETLSPEGEKSLSLLINTKRLEVALRLTGDPILPLIANHPDAPRPQDVLNRIAFGREQYRLAYGASPKGFVPGVGAIDPQFFKFFKSMGLSWVATGEYTGSALAWTASAGIAFVPLRAMTAQGLEESGPGAYVVDESDGLMPEGSLFKLLPLLAAQKSPSQAWSTLSQAVQERDKSLGDAASVKEWPTWSKGYEIWSSSSSQQAWKIYGETALALERYKNSGTAAVSLLDKATDELYAAQSNRYYRMAGSLESLTDKEFRKHLMAVYRKINQTPPEILYQSLGIAKPEENPDEFSTDIHFGEGDSWISFENPQGSVSLEPDIAASTTSLYKMLGLRLDWSGENISFLHKMERLNNTPASPASIGDLMLDTYIDLNHVADAGSKSLLEGREALALAKDAWEYALTLSGWGAFLYRSNPSGPPQLIGQYPVSADIKTGEVRVEIPKTTLRGNPRRWGYIVAALAADLKTVSNPPPRPRANLKGSLLGLLATLEQQKSYFEGPAGPKRLAALRAKP